jgi:hypothetical protein
LNPSISTGNIVFCLLLPYIYWKLLLPIHRKYAKLCRPFNFGFRWISEDIKHGIKVITSNCFRNSITVQPFLKQKLYLSLTQVRLHCTSGSYHSAFITTISAGEFIIKCLITFKFVLKSICCFNLRNKTLKSVDLHSSFSGNT